METKQTAVDWFIGQLEKKGNAFENVNIRNVYIEIDTSEYLGLMKEAKQKERKQMIAFAMNLTTIDLSKTGRDILMDEAQQLYKNLYGK